MPRLTIVEIISRFLFWAPQSIAFSKIPAMRYFLSSFGIVTLTVALILGVTMAGYAQRDVGPFNRFAESYNAYVAIDSRIQDLKALKRMRSDWHALAKSQGWPEEKCREQ